MCTLKISQEVFGGFEMFVAIVGHESSELVYGVGDVGSSAHRKVHALSDYGAIW